MADRRETRTVAIYRWISLVKPSGIIFEAHGIEHMIPSSIHKYNSSNHCVSGCLWSGVTGEALLSLRVFQVTQQQVSWYQSSFNTPGFALQNNQVTTSVLPTSIRICKSSKDRTSHQKYLFRTSKGQLKARRPFLLMPFGSRPQQNLSAPRSPGRRRLSRACHWYSQYYSNSLRGH